MKRNPKEKNVVYTTIYELISRITKRPFFNRFIQSWYIFLFTHGYEKFLSLAPRDHTLPRFLFSFKPLKHRCQRVLHKIKKRKRKELKDLFVYNEEQRLPARWLYSMIDASCENFYSWYSCSLRNKVTNITQKFFFLNACFKGLITCSLVRDALELFRIETSFNKKEKKKQILIKTNVMKNYFNITMFKTKTLRHMTTNSDEISSQNVVESLLILFSIRKFLVV